MERVRIIRQAGERGISHSRTLLASIYRAEGLRGLWRGNGVNIARVIPSYAVRFSVFGNLSDFATAYPLLANPFVAGSLSGLASSLASYPLETLRTRISVSGSLLDALRQGSLYAGCSLTVLETMPYAALSLGTYTYLTSRGNDKIVSGFSAGIAATLICFPLDTLRRNKIVSPSVSVGTLAGRLWESNGIRRFYRGIGVALTKTPPTVALTMVTNEYLLARIV